MEHVANRVLLHVLVSFPLKVLSFLWDTVPSVGDLSSLPREEKKIACKEHFSRSNSFHVHPDVCLSLPMYFFDRAGREGNLTVAPAE